MLILVRAIIARFTLHRRVRRAKIRGLMYQVKYSPVIGWGYRTFVWSQLKSPGNGSSHPITGLYFTWYISFKPRNFTKRQCKRYLGWPLPFHIDSARVVEPSYYIFCTLFHRSRLLVTRVLGTRISIHKSSRSKLDFLSSYDPIATCSKENIVEFISVIIQLLVIGWWSCDPIASKENIVEFIITVTKYQVLDPRPCLFVRIKDLGAQFPWHRRFVCLFLSSRGILQLVVTVEFRQQFRPTAFVCEPVCFASKSLFSRKYIRGAGRVQ